MPRVPGTNAAAWLTKIFSNNYLNKYFSDKCLISTYISAKIFSNKYFNKYWTNIVFVKQLFCQKKFLQNHSLLIYPPPTQLVPDANAAPVWSAKIFCKLKFKQIFEHALNKYLDKCLNKWKKFDTKHTNIFVAKITTYET